MLKSRKAAAVFLLSSMSLGLAPVSLAGSGAPTAILRSGDESQRGRGPWFTRGRHTGNGMCSDMHGDSPFEWPPALQHPSDRRLLITFARNDKPDKITLSSRHSVVPDPSAAGPSEKVPFKLRPRRKAGETVGWKVIFRRRALGHHYIWLFARWEGKHPCNYRKAPYGFHVETIESVETS